MFKEFTDNLIEFLQENKSYWNDLDAAQGDGDLGSTLIRAGEALQEVSKQDLSVKEWFFLAGETIRKNAPSTLGVLIALAFTKSSKLISNETSFRNVNWGEVQKEMINEIQYRGNAKLGDKTILDALIPAVDAYNQSISEGKDNKNALQYAAYIAKKEANKTIQMVAQTGRSSWLGEKSKGNIDGGAMFCAQLYEFISRNIK